jgi:hypothetical protein
VPKQFSELDTEVTAMVGPPPGAEKPEIASVEGEDAGGQGARLSINRVVGATTRKATDA